MKFRLVLRKRGVCGTEEDARETLLACRVPADSERGRSPADLRGRSPALRVLAAASLPGPRRWRDRSGEIEHYPEPPTRLLPSQGVREASSRLDADRPDVRRSCGKQLAGVVVCGEVHDSSGCAGCREASVLSDSIRGSVLMPMVVFEQQARACRSDHPGARTILPDVEWNADLRCGTGADVHHQLLTAERGVGRLGSLDHRSFERTATQRLERAEQLVVSGSGC